MAHAARLMDRREQDEIEEAIAALAVWVMQVAPAVQPIAHQACLLGANAACQKAREVLQGLMGRPGASLQEMVKDVVVRLDRKAQIANIVIRHKDG